MSRLSSSGRLLAVSLPLAACLGAAAQAAPATVTAVQNVVSKQPAGSTKFFRAKVGTTLDKGDRLATGKRSTAQITFADKSYVRLGERTDLVIRSATGAALRIEKGRLFGKFAKGSGAVIGGRAAVAAVKGTEMEFIVGKKGKEIVRCHQGEVSLTRVPAP
ncbi:MAG: FecR domain-containing protein [Armatimonadota bacterium]